MDVRPVVEGIGLNVTAWSYAGDLSFTVIAGREAVPDAHAITACIEKATDELAAAVADANGTQDAVGAAVG